MRQLSWLLGTLKLRKVLNIHTVTTKQATYAEIYEIVHFTRLEIFWEGGKENKNISVKNLRLNCLYLYSCKIELHLHESSHIHLCYGILSNCPGLVECYVSAKRHKEALAVAKNAHKTLGANPRTLTVRCLSCCCWFLLALLANQKCKQIERNRR